jgi:S1-C subfamily serine protease
VPGDLLDLILLALVAAFAVAGYRQGFIIGVLSLAGFVVGVAAGAYISPGISKLVAKSAPWQAFIAILVLFIAAVAGMLIASAIGVAVRSRLTGRPATFVDALGGAAVNVVAVLVVAWLIGSFAGGAPFPLVARQVSNSAVLRTVDAVMPRGTLYLPVFPALRTLLSNGLYSPVFIFGADNAANLPPADAAVLDSSGMALDRGSIVKIKGVAPSCSLQIEGSGFVISPEHVLTNAHVVAGVTQGPFVSTSSGGNFNARVVLFDPQRDIAVLDVPGLTARPLRFAPAAVDGANAIVAGFPLDSAYLTLGAARVGRSLPALGPSIYATSEVDRQIYELRALVRPGNSGGPLLAPDGRVYGVVFAASTAYLDTGYALTASEVSGDAHRGAGKYAAVSTQRCQG